MFLVVLCCFAVVNIFSLRFIVQTRGAKRDTTINLLSVTYVILVILFFVFTKWYYGVAAILFFFIGSWIFDIPLYFYIKKVFFKRRYGVISENFTTKLYKARQEIFDGKIDLPQVSERVNDIYQNPTPKIADLLAEYSCSTEDAYLLCQNLLSCGLYYMVYAFTLYPYLLGEHYCVLTNAKNSDTETPEFYAIVYTRRKIGDVD